MLVPPHVQGFAFAWLQLISHRSFMPHLLLVKGQKGWPYMHRLLISLLVFLQPFLKTGELNEAIRKLYKGMLRVLLVLLHDFPEFLSEYHVSFCDAIPSTCVQLRNLILSAFPRTMRLPDPFRNLNVDNLPEMNQPPKVLADYANALGNMKKRLDNYLMTKQPAEFPALIPQVLNTGGTYNVTLISVLTLYVGSKDVEFQGRVHQAATPAMEIFKVLVRVLDPEGCHHVLNAIANQLRYPNSHTRYFMRLILTLFVEADSEYLQEQITRVLLERLIVHRPHPWGLLVTFMELIKNPRFAFWQRSFTKCAPEIEKVFESVVRSCMGPDANSSDLMKKNSSDQ
jgi:CCR4-NOT transcription complex subunit 1